MFWGLTPAIDLLDELKLTTPHLPETVNILLVGGSDCRHVLQTLARRYRHKKVRLNFHIVDACVESIARQLLLLNVALQPPGALGLDQKTKIFMELYGNSLIRPSVAKYLASSAKYLIKMITDCEYLKRMMPWISLDIKYRERDYLENVLKFWCSMDQFDVVHCWDRRLRKTLGCRYDSRVGAFDWDLHMRLHSAGGTQICSQEYRSFRSNGVAFTWLESEVSKPNRTLVCTVLPDGDRFVHYGYLGDIETGPFVAYGLDCEDRSYLKSDYGKNSYRATDVTERNLKQIFYEILNREGYSHRPVSDAQLGPAVIRQEEPVVDVKGHVGYMRREIEPCVPLDDSTIRFLSIATLNTMNYRDEYEELYDVIYFNSNYLKYFNGGTVGRVSKGNALLLIENPIYFLSNRKKQLEDFAGEVKRKLDGVSYEEIDYDCEKDAYIKIFLNKK